MHFSLIIVIIILLCSSCINLFGHIFQKNKLAGISKVFLVPSIILLCYLINPDIPIIIYLGLIFGWLGDLFLLSEKDHMFLLGLSSFLIGHILYMVAVSQLVFTYDVFIVIVSAVILCTVMMFVFFSLHRHVPKIMKIPVTTYLLSLVGINFFSINLLFQNFTVAAVILVCGSVLFLCSDYVLARSMFIKKTALGDFVVMLTYISAQLLIGLYFALT